MTLRRCVEIDWSWEGQSRETYWEAVVFSMPRREVNGGLQVAVGIFWIEFAHEADRIFLGVTALAVRLKKR